MCHETNVRITDIRYFVQHHLAFAIFFLKKKTRGSSVLIKRRSKASKINFGSSIASDSNTEVAPLIGVIFVPDALIRIVSFVDGSEKRYTLIVR